MSDRAFNIWMSIIVIVGLGAAVAAYIKVQQNLKCRKICYPHAGYSSYYGCVCDLTKQQRELP